MKNTTKTKREKRPYNKKTLLTQDELWKVIIPLLWAPFLRFTLEDWADKIDFTRKPDMLDKEMKRLMLRSKAKNRAVDILMRVYMKDGTSKPFLFHIEVQGYPDADFKRRLFQYYYRIDDLLEEPIETLVIMIDEDPENRPTDYEQAFGQTSVYFKFRMFKLLDNPPPYRGKEDNPFAVVFEVAWHALKQHRLKTDEDLMALKYRLIKRLLENQTDGETIYALFDFINIYLPFGDKEKSTTFERELDLLIDKENDMTPLTMQDLRYRHIREQERWIARKEFKEEFKEELKAAKEERKVAKQEARMRQEEVQRREEAERKLIDVMLELHNEGFSIEKIATMMRQSQDAVKKVIDEKIMNA
jgi:hypothetical protein